MFITTDRQESYQSSYYEEMNVNKDFSILINIFHWYINIWNDKFTANEETSSAWLFQRKFHILVDLVWISVLNTVQYNNE